LPKRKRSQQTPSGSEPILAPREQHHAPVLRNCVLLAALSAVVYGFYMHGPFISDDLALISDNPHIRQLDKAWQFFTPHYWNEVHRGTKGVFRPLRELTFTFIYAAFGAKPWPYHIFSLIVHIVNVLLVYLLARRVLRHELAALLGAALFAVHPVHVEAVLWAKNLAELEAGLLVLGAFLLFLRVVEREGGPFPLWAAGGAVALYALVLTCKESGLALSVVLLAYSLLALPRSKWRAAAWVVMPRLALSLLYVVFQFASSQLVSAAVSGMGRSPEEGLAMRPALVAKSYAWYYGLLLFPVQLCAQYHFESPETYCGAETWPYLLAFAAIAMALGVALWHWRRGAWLLLWPALFLAPASNIIPFKGRPIGDQRLYVASIGFCLLLGVVTSGTLQLLVPNELKRRVLKVTVAAIMVAMGALSFARGPVWMNEDLFWFDMLRKSPVQAEAEYRVGQVYFDRGEYMRALIHASYCTQGDSTHARGYVLYARCNAVMGDKAEAVLAYKQAAAAYIGLKQPNDAARTLLEALQIAPNDAEAKSMLRELGERSLTPP
jgi:protein O-mannosyl-transferase